MKQQYFIVAEKGTLSKCLSSALIIMIMILWNDYQCNLCLLLNEKQ